MSATITVLLVDDHALVRRGFRRLLEDDPAITIVGEASTAAEAVPLAVDLAPQVVVMDCAMPGGNGLAATRAILERRPDTAISSSAVSCSTRLGGARSPRASLRSSSPRLG
jgi:DNA-binding NarL/FixJ family response regulator